MDANTDVALQNGHPVSAKEELGDTSSAMSKTTTISTIAVQSGKTRLVIALLHCGDWLQLKILEVSPELTALGNTLSEAIELQQAHDEVLRQLQNKQSPVEELLRQADQLISTQKPRAEVYAAMAESLGRAWKDINFHLDLRKQVLDLNVQYHTKADEFFTTLNSLEVACSDSLVPIDVDAIKQFLTDIHDLRRSLLEALMGALQTGNSLLAKLRELGAEGTLDSRPDRIRCSVNRAISQVQGWLDQLHGRRQVLEITFTRRKTQLEQCLGLAILASDLREVEDTLKEKLEILRNTDQLGDSSSSAELLLHEHKKLLPEAMHLQERALKITKATEQLVESGCFAGDRATEQAYSVLSGTSDYVTELEQRNLLLDRVITFFRKAQTALTKLDQLEIQITTSELPSTSPQLAQLHEQCARAIQEITSAPIAEGYSILNTAGRSSHGTDGVKRMVEELENRKITLDALCTAHREEKLRINQALNSFLEQQNELYAWLISAAEAFLQGHQDMGSDLPMARDFWDLHNRLLVDLQTKGNEINALLLTLPPVLEFLEDNQRYDVDQKVEELHQLWLKLKNILETRLDLSAIYVKFHTEADYVNKQIDQLEDILNNSPKDVDEDTLNQLEEKWESLIPLYQSAKNTGITFMNATSKVSEPYLDTKRACVCVESILEKLSGRQLVVTRNWQSFHTNVVEKREIQMQLQLNMTESTKTINWITKLDTHLYPVITTNAINPEDVKTFLEKKLEAVFPEIRRAQNEVEQRIKAVETLITKTAVDESTLNVKNKLIELNQKLVEITTEYQILLQMLITFFNNLADMDNTVNDLNMQFAKTSLPNQIVDIDAVVNEQEASKRAILEMFKFAQNDVDKLVVRINKQEPKDAADYDISKLQHQILFRKNNWEEVYTTRSNMLITHRQYSVFNYDLSQINEAINDVSKQLSEIKGQYGESLSAAKTTSQAFGYFEKTTDLLNQRIDAFAEEAKKLVEDGHMNSPHIKLQIAQLQEKWDALKRQINETRHLIDLSIKYFSIVDEAIQWFKEGSHILVSIARRSTAVKKPEEAQALLNEIDNFLKPGEIKQAERIGVITSLAKELYQPQIKSKSAQVIVDHQEMLESFSSISRELQSLVINLYTAEEERERFKREQEAADALLAAAKAEAERARAAAEAAENARRAAEAESKRIAEEEARRRAEEEARKRVEEEARRRAEEEARRRADEEMRRIVEETRRRAEEEARKRAEEEARKRFEEETRRRLEEEARRRAEEEAQRRAEEEEARQRAAEEARRRAEEEARQRAVEEARRCAEEEAKQRALEEARKRAEEETRQRAIEEARRRAEEEAKQRALEEARRRADEEARQRAVEEAQRRAEEEAQRRALEEVQRRAEEARQRAEEEARKRAIEDARRRSEEEARRRAEEEAKRIEQEMIQRSFQMVEVDKPSRIITTNINNPATKIDVSNEKLVNEEIIRTVEIVKVTHLEHNTPQQINKSEITFVEMASPVFILPLTDTILQEGSKFTFICQVRGNPTPTVAWYKDGMPIENNPDYQTSFDEGTCTLTIEETFGEDTAKYTCKATNAAGSAETNAILSVKEVQPEEELIPPTFVKYLEPAIVKQGQKFQFECKVEGHPLPNVQWFKNSECIDNCPDYSITYNNGEAILRFEEVTLDHQANFTCKACNQIGTAQTTANLCVEPYEKTQNPFFVIPLSNVMARAGQKIKLECEVSGLPVPSLAWTHNGKTVKETRELKLQIDDKRSTLVISEAFPKDAGTYTVTAKNEVGQAISECNVTVKGRLPTETSDSEIASDMEPIKPSIQVPLKDVSVFDGKTVRLDCVIVGQPEPEVIWYHDEKPVKESADFQLLFQGDRCSLVIQEAFAEDAGQYKVVALNSAGEASSKCTLTVTPLNGSETVTKEAENAKPTGFPPKFNKLLTDVLAAEGENITLQAAVDGDPHPEIKWLLNNQDIETNEHLTLIHDTEGNVKLEIEKVLPEDKGVYTVKASNLHGDAKCFAQLIVKSFKPPEIQKEYEEVKSPPTFKETFADRQAFEETAVKFECIVTGKPTPKIKWLFNDDAVSGKDFLISTSGDRQVLSIPNVSKSNSGKITCIAENDVGKATCTAMLSVVSGDNSCEPKPVTDLQQISNVPSYSSKKEVHVQSSTTSTSTVITNSGTGEPDIQTHGLISKDSQSFKQINEEPPQVHESHVVEEFHKVGKEPGVVQEHFLTTVTMGDENKAKQTTISTIEHQPRVIKSRPPKFTSPIVGKIVDQGVDVVLEGIIDGYPSPSIKWEKNGSEITNSDKITVSHEFNRVKIEIKNVTNSDGGRYTCTAINDAGSAISTSDLVVRKTVFPPVFGRRLQAQVVKKGDRVHMEIEVTGTPTPTVTWFKDDKPIKEVLPSGYKIRVQGNSHTLVIEKVDFAHTGKYMARAVNEGGEAQSIADFAVFEPTPDTMVEVVKTVVFEDVHKHETLAKAAEQSKTTFATPQVKTIPIPTSKSHPVHLVSLKSTPKSYIETSENISESESSSKAEYSTLTETTVSKESKTIRIESNTAGFSPEIFKDPIKRVSPIPIEIEKPTEILTEAPSGVTTEDVGIETNSITKQSSLDYFVQKLKENDESIKPKELPKGTPLQAEIYTKFEDVKQTELPPFLTKQTEEKIVNESVFSQRSYINEPFNLIPEPPPEIYYTPKHESYQRDDTTRQLKSETVHKHTHYETKLTPITPPVRPTSPRPSTEALEMEKLWTPHREPERPLITSPLLTRPISSASEPSAEGLAMEKAWAHKSEIHREHAWPPAQPIEETKSWSTQTTLEKKWAPVQTKSETIIKESRIINEPTPRPLHYIAKVTDLHEKGYGHLSSTMESTEIQENVVYEHSARPSEIIKSWPPPSRVEDVKPTYKPVMPSIHSLSIRPASVQDITDEVYLEPGPPPEIDYAPPPCEIKSVPPPLPPKQERPQAPPIPARPFRPNEPKSEHQPFRRVPKLQPLPFHTEEVKPKPIKPGPPPTPIKFLKGRFADSDYESDYESSKIPVKWKPYTSDTEEPSYRHVKAPKFSPATRSKSVEPIPLPTQFPQPTYVHQPYKGTSYTQKFVEPKREISPPPLKPGTPPEYLETDVKYKNEAKQVIDGYMADTDEPLTLRKRISKFESKQHEMKSEYYSSSSESSRQKLSYESQSTTKPSTPKFYRKTTTTVPAPKKELVATPIITSVSTTKNKVIHRDDRDSSLEPFPYKSEPVRVNHPKGPPPPSPSKFVKGEFKENEHESDYEGRITSVWRSDSEPRYKPVRPVLTPSGKHSEATRRTPTPPTEFDQPPHFSGPPRPKFEPIEKPLAASKLSESLSQKSTVSQVVHKPKPVTPKSSTIAEKHIQPGSPPEIVYASGPKTTQYYRSTTSAPYQNAVQTETSNVMHFKEHTEHCHRSMSLEQTHKIITFGQDHKEKLVKPRVPLPTTPTKFVKKEFRENDYESEIENAKIKSVWGPGIGESNEPRYRQVRPPQTVTHFETHGRRDRVLSPMEFETPTKLHDNKESFQNVSGIRKQFEDNVDNKIVKYNNVGLKPGSPPQYSYSPVTVTKIASKNMENMSHTFKSKAQQFASDIMMDVNKKTSEKVSDSPQVYREETRASQHGTKHVDPDTGLIYFKYDFGYEFGIILPGQGKGGEIPAPKKAIIQPPKRTKDIEMPVYHESTQPKYNSTPAFRPVKINHPSKTVKWDPTSESEMSECEDGKKKYLSSPRWEQSSTSPYSISPSLPSTSPAFNLAVYRGSDVGSSAPTTPVNREQNLIYPKRPPLFITPLRDIAVVSGQAARFECIVQSESTPSILWSKNGRIIENSEDLQIYYRNGVCRLTIPQAYPEDAGSYTCTATNQIGAVGTTATLQVPGERRSQYIK